MKVLSPRLFGFRFLECDNLFSLSVVSLLTLCLVLHHMCRQFDKSNPDVLTNFLAQFKGETTLLLATKEELTEVVANFNKMKSGTWTCPQPLLPWQQSDPSQLEFCQNSMIIFDFEISALPQICSKEKRKDPIKKETGLSSPGVDLKSAKKT